MPKIIQLIVPPVILSLALPLVLIASVTTTLALAALILRASIVYFELAVALFQSWIFPRAPTPLAAKRRRSELAATTTDKTRRRSRSGNGGTSGSHTPVRSESFAALVGIGANRDFEGLGGWREAVDPRDDETWTGLNSRLELPAKGGSNSAGQRRHKRTLSSQSHVTSIASDALKMSTVSGSAKPLQAGGISQEAIEYFNGQHRGSESGEAEDLIPMSPEENVARVRMDQRRRSLSAVSNASSGSSSKSVNHVATS